MSEYDDKHWHLDKRIPVAIIVTILFQTVGIVWWAASLSARVDALEVAYDALRTHQARIVRLEANQDSVYKRLDRIEALNRRIEGKLDKLLLETRRGWGGGK